MIATTLPQPHAALVAMGVQTILTCSWPAPASAIGSRIAIHASARRPTPQRGPMFVGDFHVGQGGTWLHGPGDGVLVASVDVRMAFGAVIGSAVLAACLPIETPDSEVARAERMVWTSGAGDLKIARYEPGSEPDGHPWVDEVDVSDQLPYGDFAPGRWAWVLTDAAPCEDRCPACWGTIPRAVPGHCIDIDGEWWHKPGDCVTCDCCDATCPVCHGDGRCGPIPARGRQRLWRFEPT